LSLTIAALFLATGCTDDGLCYYNCPDDPRKICGSEDMGPDDGAKCEALANQKCAEHPEELEDWDAGVVFQLITCGGNEVCGVPTWCLN
jgi:hypothetical protein